MTEENGDVVVVNHQLLPDGKPNPMSLNPMHLLQPSKVKKKKKKKSFFLKKNVLGFAINASSCYNGCITSNYRTCCIGDNCWISTWRSKKKKKKTVEKNTSHHITFKRNLLF
jgi:hypothetical protein